MADIELVVKIPEEYYERMKNTSFWWSGMKNCILKGIVIPKGHGELIDRQELLKSTMCKTFGLRTVDVENAPTVIEADRSEEE